MLNGGIVTSWGGTIGSTPEGRGEAAFAGDGAGESAFGDLGEKPDGAVQVRFPRTIGADDDVEIPEREMNVAKRAVIGDAEFLKSHVGGVS